VIQMFINVFPRFVFVWMFCFCFIIFLLIYLFIRPILTYNSEIWFMDDYFSISRAAISRSEQSGSVCDTLSLENKFCYEKIHNKFCKYILGLKKTACNISTKSELGRFSITDFI
jgi:hypothetical protein